MSRTQSEIEGLKHSAALKEQRREFEKMTALRLNQEGHTFREIGARLGLSERMARVRFLEAGGTGPLDTTAIQAKCEQVLAKLGDDPRVPAKKLQALQLRAQGLRVHVIAQRLRMTAYEVNQALYQASKP